MISGFLEILLAYRLSRESWDSRQAGAGQDRRVFHRVPASVSCRLSNPMFGLESAGTTVDLSLDGMGVLASVNWSQGSQIRISMESVGFEAAGLIVFRKEEAPQFRYGVRFQRTGFLEIAKLRRFLQQHHSGRLSI